jgi:tetratricopeptide (TPR) repeat protein
MTRLLISLFLLLSISTPATTAIAAPKDTGTAPDETASERAGAYDREGKILYGSGDLEGAVRAFRLAWRTDPRPSFLFNAGKALERLERFDEAVDTYDHYLRVASGDKERAAAAELCERLCPKAGRGILVLISEPTGAELVIDAEPYPLRTGARVCLVPGEHVVAFSLDGHEALTKTVRVPRAETVALRAELKRRRAVGTLRVESSITPAHVSVDGRVVGEAPIDLRLGADRPVLVLVSAGDGYHPWTQSVSVSEGHHKTLRAFPQPLGSGGLNTTTELSSSSTFNWGYVTAGLGVALAITGGILYAIAYDRYDTANGMDAQAEGYDARFDDLVSEGNSYQGGAFVTWGVAGALGVATAFVWDSGPAPDRQGRALGYGGLPVVGLQTTLRF